MKITGRGVGTTLVGGVSISRRCWLRPPAPNCCAPIWATCRYQPVVEADVRAIRPIRRLLAQAVGTDVSQRGVGSKPARRREPYQGPLDRRRSAVSACPGDRLEASGSAWCSAARSGPGRSSADHRGSWHAYLLEQTMRAGYRGNPLNARRRPAHRRADLAEADWLKAINGHLNIIVGRRPSGWWHRPAADWPG